MLLSLPPVSGTAITIGNFDGVHLGHVALVRRARELSPRVVALGFDPHPMSVLRPEGAPARLTTFERRAELLRAAGADVVERLAPTPDFLDLTPEQFVAWVVERHGPSVIVEGSDFNFGKARRGDVAMLAALGKKHGFAVEVVLPVEVAQTDHQIARASSTLVRWLLGQGRVADAARVLGRRYELSGMVVRGDRRGRTIGYPTANVASACLAPAEGVYAALARLADGRAYAAGVNVGTRPTFDGVGTRVEAHLMDFDAAALEGEYGWPLTLEFVAWLRDDLRFHSVEALVAQIGRDCARAKEACVSLLGSPSASLVGASACV